MSPFSAVSKREWMPGQHAVRQTSLSLYVRGPLQLAVITIHRARVLLHRDQLRSLQTSRSMSSRSTVCITRRIGTVVDPRQALGIGRFVGLCWSLIKGRIDES